MRVIFERTGVLGSLVAGICLSSPSAFSQWLEPYAIPLLEVESSLLADFYGWTVVPLGDVDDDTIIDFAVSAVFRGAGVVYGISGADGSEMWRHTESFGNFVMGFAMETAGDVDGDEKTDVLVGSPFDGDNGGRVWLLSGSNGDVIHRFDSETSFAAHGGAVEAEGDFNGDGVDDFFISAFIQDVDGLESAGVVYVYSGIDYSIITRIEGDRADGELGIGLGVLGDINDDGAAEIVVGQRLEDFWSGLAHVYSWNGEEAVRLYTVDNVGMGYNIIGDRIDAGRDLDGDGKGDFTVGDLFLGEVDVFSGAAGTPLYTIFIEGEEEDLAPNQMIDDINGDSVPDIIAGAWNSDEGTNFGGRVHLISGVDGTLIRTMTYLADNGGAGADVRSAGDFDQDGYLDFVVGATGGGWNGEPPGRFIVLKGTPLAISLNAPDGCPGQARLKITGASPNGPVGVLMARSTGSTVIASGPCTGLEIGLAASYQVVTIRNADGDGNLNVFGTLPSGACGRFIQVVDGRTCTPSNVVQVE